MMLYLTRGIDMKENRTMSDDPQKHAAHFIGKQYKTRLTEEEAAYVERVRVARKFRAISQAIRLLVQDGMTHGRFEKEA